MSPSGLREGPGGFGDACAANQVLLHKSVLKVEVGRLSVSFQRCPVQEFQVAEGCWH